MAAARSEWTPKRNDSPPGSAYNNGTGGPDAPWEQLCDDEDWLEYGHVSWQPGLDYAVEIGEGPCSWL